MDTLSIIYTNAPPTSYIVLALGVVELLLVSVF